MQIPKEQNKRTRKINLEKSREYHREKTKRNPEIYQKIRKNQYYKDVDKTREYGRTYMKEKRKDPAYKEKDNKRSTEYNKKHRKQISAKTLKRYHNDPDFNLLHKLRGRCNKLIKKSNGKKSCRTLELLGIELSKARDLLINKFNKKYNCNISFQEFLDDDNIVIDHIIPCEAFDLSLGSAQKMCFHYTNLQLLKSEDNDNKSDFIFGQRARFLEKKLTGLEDWLKLKDWKQEIKCK